LTDGDADANDCYLRKRDMAHTAGFDVKRTLRIAALTSHLVLIVKSPQFERSDPGDRLFVRCNRSDWSTALDQI